MILLEKGAIWAHSGEGYEEEVPRPCLKCKFDVIA
jgi:hypothetical protein